MKSRIFLFSFLALGALVACEGKSEAPAQAPDKAPASAPASAPGSAPASAPGSGPASQSTSAPAEAGAMPANGPLEAVGKDKRYKFKITMIPSEPKVGELFKAETTVVDAKTGAPVKGLDLKLDATMPHHKHGMMTRPVHKELGEGKYLTEGMKMHMSGRWELRVDAHTKGSQDHAVMVWHQSPVSKLAQPDKDAPK